MIICGSAQTVKLICVDYRGRYICIPMKNNFLNRITIDPQILFGKPSIGGLRYPVQMILDLLGAGMSTEELLEDYPDLEKEDIQACLLFALKMMSVKSIHEVKAA